MHIRTIYNTAAVLTPYAQDPNRKLVMGGKEVETEPEGRKPPTFKKA